MSRYASFDRYYSVTLRLRSYNKTSCLWGHPDFSSVLVMLRARLPLPPSLPSLSIPNQPNTMHDIDRQTSDRGRARIVPGRVIGAFLESKLANGDPSLPDY